MRQNPSSLDKDTDSIIQNNIEKFLPNMTKIIITHRPFLAHKVDQIITLDNLGAEKPSPDQAYVNFLMKNPNKFQHKGRLQN